MVNGSCPIADFNCVLPVSEYRITVLKLEVKKTRINSMQHFENVNQHKLRISGPYAKVVLILMYLNFSPIFNIHV